MIFPLEEFIMKILMVVTDGFEDLEAIGTLAILRRARLDVTFAAIDNNKATGRYGLVSSDMVNLKDVDFSEYDCLVIPGGPEYIAESQLLSHDPELLFQRQGHCCNLCGTDYIRSLRIIERKEVYLLHLDG